VTPATQPPSVWLWGEFPQQVRLAVNLRRTPDWSRFDRVEARLYERMPFGRLQVAQAELPVLGGIVTGNMTYQRAPAPEADRGGDDRRRADAPVDIRGVGHEELDIGDLLGDDGPLAGGTPYILIVEAHAAGARPVTRRIELEAGPRGPAHNRF